MFDRSAHRAQVARIAAHGAGGEVLLKLNGAGEAFPAAIAAERPSAARALEGIPGRSPALVTIARDVRYPSSGALVFAGERPREGQHFTDPAGQTLRIEEDRTVPHAATFVYACAVA